MEFKIYLYDNNGNLLGIYLAPSKEEFESNKLKYCSEYREGENFISFAEITHPVIDNNEIREMLNSEKITAGIIVLKEGEYLENEEIKYIEKPNEYCTWNIQNNQWEEDKNLKLKILKDSRYFKQQLYIKYKKELEEKELEKTEFEEFGFDTTITEDRITEITEEMNLLKAEITKLSKEINSLNKEINN